MPHIVVKMFTGRSEDEKRRLAERVSLAVMNAIGASESSISVAVEDIAPENWGVEVFDPEIAGHPETLYKRPGYERF